ncbi:MAG: PilT/PilU family type 4a pilus ATPase [Verrucomicrobiales bacterium]
MHDLIDFLTETRDRGGSDLHIMAGAPPAARVYGTLQPLGEAPLTPDQCKDLIFGILTERQRAALESEWEVDFALHVDGVGRFRANAHYARRHAEAAFRYIPERIPELTELGHGEVVEDLCALRQGLVLVTGMTGMGKTTTLAAMAKRIADQRSCVIVTIEDPIEYVFEHSYGLVKQRQVGEDTKDFAKALRSALRQDPDVIIVSEMRDLETISTAISAAETGHLVISTLHTIDAPKSLDRLVDAFPPDQQSMILSQLANCLEAIVSQQLIPRADEAGRVMASEIMIANHGISACIRDRKFEQILGLMQIGAHDGMHTIDDSLAHLYKGGYISIEQAIALCRDEEYLERLAPRIAG